MCGIAGILVRGTRLAPELIEQATNSLAHRGPDDAGTVILREQTPEPVEIGLGNRRLAILDLSPLGHQPMHDSETGNWLVYNGEIYNFQDVRQKLEAEGVSFRSHSDTEVLLKAYARWGERCLTRMRGMFAFALWDARQKRLILGRDPMGIKPLYYFASDRHLLFASEVRTLLKTGLVPRKLDPAGLLTYLTFGSLYDPITLIDGVRALRAGHFLVWENGNIREEKYWNLADETGASAAPNRVQAEEEVRALLEESVRMQMVSDVPVGVFLSGGIDSSGLASILGRAGLQISTFSIVFSEADYSEAEYSRRVAKKFGTDHHELLVSQQQALGAVPAALQAMDLPTIDGFNTYLVSQHTRAAGVKVALSGLGGDELFAGYSSFRTVPRLEQFLRWWQHVPAAARTPLAGVFSLLAPDSDGNRKLAELARANGHLLHPYFLSRMLFTPKWRSALLQVSDSQALARAEDALAEGLKQTSTMDPINRVSYLESRCYMLNTLLRDSDVMSMAHGLEVRVPLIDHCLAQKLMGIPGAWKLDPHTPKPLLVRALQGSLPDEIVHRPKRGFTLPFEHWLRGELRAEVEGTLRRIGSGALAKVVNAKAVDRIWQDFLERRVSWSRPWSLFVLQRWCELQDVTVL